MRHVRAVSRLVATAVGASIFLFHADVARADIALTEIIARVKPSVVAVGTYQKTRSPPFLYRGTGFVVGDGTLIATAAHVVAEVLATEDRETMMVLIQVPGARERQGREAKVIGVDKAHDVALLRVSGAPLAPLPLGNSDAVRDGLDVAFTGFPLGTALGLSAATHRAIVASLAPIALPGPNASKLDGRVIQGLKSDPFLLFQLDAAAFPGHSGSPLYNADTGEVIGIVNVGLLAKTKDAAVGQPSGISFAIPIQHLQELMRSVR